MQELPKQALAGEAGSRSVRPWHRGKAGGSAWSGRQVASRRQSVTPRRVPDLAWTPGVGEPERGAQKLQGWSLGACMRRAKLANSWAGAGTAKKEKKRLGTNNSLPDLVPMRPFARP